MLGSPSGAYIHAVFLLPAARPTIQINWTKLTSWYSYHWMLTQLQFTIAIQRSFALRGTLLVHSSCYGCSLLVQGAPTCGCKLQSLVANVGQSIWSIHAVFLLPAARATIQINWTKWTSWCSYHWMLTQLQFTIAIRHSFTLGGLYQYTALVVAAVPSYKEHQYVVANCSHWS